VPPGAQWWGSWWGPPPPGFYGSPPPRPPRPHPLLTLAAGIAAAAMIALGVGIGYIVWGSPTAAVRSRSSLPVTPRVPSSGATTNHGFLGVVISPSAPAASGTSGAQVLKVVPGYPAAKAGIVAGDTITSFGTHKVVSSITLEFDTRQDPPGTKVSVAWSTSTGKHEHATLTLAKAPKSGTSLG
jgi:S1-C subfamily serine protease